ncbi:MAG: TolA protein [Labilithrix sp.]|nr:TolA protein [Labilithrix sp.]
MASRSPEIPIVLWVCAAVCAHFLMGGGTEEVSKQLRKYSDDRQYLSMLGSKTRERVRASEQTLDIAVVDEGVKPKDEDPPEPPKPPPVAEKKPDPAKPEPPKPQEQKKAEPPKPEVKIVVKDEDPLKKLDEQELKSDKRIAVKQHVQPKQEDNPNAKFIADEANKVEEEKVATQTAHDEDAENPTPGATKTAGPKDRTGDSERTKIADSDEHKGNKDNAPGEKGTEFDVQKDNKPVEKPQATAAVTAPASAATPKSGGDGRAPSQITQKETPPQLAPGAQPSPSPDLVQSPNGAVWFTPVKPGAQAAQDPIAGTTNQNKPVVPNTQQSTKWLGLGGNPGPGQVNLNLSTKGVVAVVGSEQLRKEREADGERRKSEHRGSWTASNFERWKNAIENYVSSVKPGNQTALNTAAVPFASYLNTIHNRIHPLFADSFLGSLDNLPKSHPMNSPKIKTSLEIVVSPKEGRIVKMGIVKTSGITAFDIAALDSVHRAQPFGPAPGAIVSADGNVYLHWEFHRDEVFACSTMHARPFLLNTPAKTPTEEPQPPAPAPKGPQERGAPPVNLHEMREGVTPPALRDPQGRPQAG